MHDTSAYEDLTIKQRLNTYNCKFYSWPEIGISEITTTLLENMDYLQENSDILDMEFLHVFPDNTKKIDRYLCILDSKKEQKDMLHFMKILECSFHERNLP